MTEQMRQLGNYRLVRLIGQGGFADVYLGEHIHLRTQAAIKVLQMRLGANSIQGFLEEARTIAHLVHPNIIRVLDFGVQNNIPFLVMDYAPCGTFRQRFLQGRPRALAGLLPYMKQAAEALQHAHDNNLIHRDVKPENMLLGLNDEVLLSDFGLALMTHNSASRTRTETAGTAAYMAPEQLQGRPRPASDQYALGVITYEWLTGTCPFVGSFFEIASQQVLGRPEPLHYKVPGIATQVEEVVLTALAKDPLRRYSNVKAFVHALEQAYASEPSHDIPPGAHTTHTTLTTHIPHTFDAAAFVRANTLKSGDTATSTSMKALPGASGALPAVDRTLLLNEPGRRPGTYSASQKDVSTSRMQELNRSSLLDTGGVSAQAADLMSQSARMRALSAAHADAAAQGRRLLPAGNEEARPTENSTRTRQLAPIPTYEEYMNRALQRRDQGSQNGQVPFSSGQFPSPFSAGNSQGSAKISESAPSKVVLPRLLEPEELRIQPPGASSGTLSASSSMSMGNSQAVPPMSTRTLAEQYEVERGASASSAGTVSQTRGADRAGSNPGFMERLIGQRWSGGGEVWGPNRLLLLILAIIIILATLLSIVYLRRPTSMQNSGMTTISATATASTGSRNVQATRTPVGGGQNADPYAPYTGVLALNDPLLQNNNNWLEGAADGGSCRFTASGYQIYATLTTPPAVCFASTTNFSNFTYEITMKFSMVGLKYSGGGIAFRANISTDSFYFFEVMDSRSYALQSCINHVCKPLAGFPGSTQQFPFINSGVGASNKLAVVVAGNTYTFYVNGQQVIAYTDTGVPLNVTGSIGVMATEGYDVANDRQQPTTALFTNAKVWR